KGETVWGLVAERFKPCPPFKPSRLLDAEMAQVRLPEEIAPDVLAALRDAAQEHSELGPSAQASATLEAWKEGIRRRVGALELSEEVGDQAVEAMDQIGKVLEKFSSSERMSPRPTTVASTAYDTSTDLRGDRYPVALVQYGVVPGGYRETSFARPLVPGER